MGNEGEGAGARKKGEESSGLCEALGLVGISEARMDSWKK